YPENIFGVHLNVAFILGGFKASLLQLFGSFAPRLFWRDRESDSYSLKHFGLEGLKESGYMHIQATKPDTVGVGLNDSPVGLMTYILEKFSTWTNPSFRDLPDGGLEKKFTKDELLTIIMIYWVNGNILSSQRYYREFFSDPEGVAFTNKYIKAPVGLASFPYDLGGRIPIEVIETVYNITHYTLIKDGGHFAAFEMPNELAEDVFVFMKNSVKFAKFTMANVGSVKLLNGRDFPLLGLGTWQATDEAQLENAMRAALDIGYRYFDTAVMYQNEQIIGKVIEEYIKAGKVKREDIFITSKLPIYGHSDPGKHVEESLERLRTDYIDLYLIHTPTPMKANSREELFAGKAEIDLTSHIDTWKGLEKYYNEGKLKAIGVSNFNEDQIQDLYNKATVKPMNNQVECHVLHPQNKLFEFCKKLGITLTAYAPIGSPGRPDAVKNGVKPEEDPMAHPITQKLAKKYNKTPAQILIRQLMQRGISVIPKSTNEKRLKENFDVLDFSLTEEEVKEFNTIKEDKQLFVFDFVKNHPYHPWKSVLRERGLIE
ncbi:hypothetical protein FO519_007045, partial [Halicephalobus sp. NKZ332]